MQKRQRGDSNPCGQSPMDFESISLTTRTHCLRDGQASFTWRDIPMKGRQWNLSARTAADLPNPSLQSCQAGPNESRKKCSLGEAPEIRNTDASQRGAEPCKAPSGDRTHDRTLTKRTLCQLSYRGLLAWSLELLPAKRSKRERRLAWHRTHFSWRPATHCSRTRRERGCPAHPPSGAHRICRRAAQRHSSVDSS